jgi:hypothetical protein
MDSLPVIDKELRQNGSFPYWRIHTPDPLRTLAFGESGLSRSYLITQSAPTKIESGILMPSVLAISTFATSARRAVTTIV